MLHEPHSLWDIALLEHEERIRDAAARMRAGMHRGRWRATLAARLRRWADALQPVEAAAYVAEPQARTASTSGR
jgi:hypothetical protein